MLDQKTKDIVKSTVPALRAHGVEITTAFYNDMFERYPAVKEMFNMDKQKSGHQPKALAMTVLAAAENIDDLSVLAPAVEKIGKVHVGTKVKAEHYPIVGECLLRAIKTVLGDAATDEVLNAWEQAYGEIANIFIGVEKKMYEEK